MESMAAKARSIFHIPDIVHAIFRHLDPHDRLRSRLISATFDFVATKYLTFNPILSDLTKVSILRMGPDLRINSIQAVGLHKALPVNNLDQLDSAFHHIKSLTFFECVSKTNKEILLRSFPCIQELKYINAVSFALPQGVNLDLLRTLEIRSPVYDETGSLHSFFSQGRFPVLENVELHLQTRLDFLLYLEVHNFIAVHLKQLKRLSLQFGCDFMLVNSEISKMFTNFPQVLTQRWDKIATIFETNQNSVDCTLRYLRCEGFGRFRLSAILYQNLKSLSPNAQIPRPYQADPDRYYTTAEDEDNEDSDEGVVIEDPDDANNQQIGYENSFMHFSSVPLLHNHEIEMASQNNAAVSIEEIQL